MWGNAQWLQVSVKKIAIALIDTENCNTNNVCYILKNVHTKVFITTKQKRIYKSISNHYFLIFDMDINI